MIFRSKKVTLYPCLNSVNFFRHFIKRLLTEEFRQRVKLVIFTFRVSQILKIYKITSTVFDLLLEFLPVKSKSNTQLMGTTSRWSK